MVPRGNGCTYKGVGEFRVSKRGWGFALRLGWEVAFRRPNKGFASPPQTDLSSESEAQKCAFYSGILYEP